MLGLGNDSMFQAEPYDFACQLKSCELLYGVAPRPQWVTTEFVHRLLHHQKWCRFRPDHTAHCHLAFEPARSVVIFIRKQVRAAMRLRESWSGIDKMASQQNGLNLLSEKFNTCRPLNNSEMLKEKLEDLYYESAQYDTPCQNSVAMICNGIDGAPQGTDILVRIFTGVKAINSEQPCLHMLKDVNFSSVAGWDWQACTEMVMPIGCGSNDTMFEASPFDIADYIKGCQETYGVTPRPHWITTEFGGHDIKSVLEKFGSNIIFSNGLRDPYSSVGVLHNISDSIVALATSEGSHCLDLLPSRPDDPEWLVAQRNAEIEIIVGWIAEYNASIAAKTGTIV